MDVGVGFNVGRDGLFGVFGGLGRDDICGSIAVMVLVSLVVIFCRFWITGVMCLVVECCDDVDGCCMVDGGGVCCLRRLLLFFGVSLVVLPVRVDTMVG